MTQTFTFCSKFTGQEDFTPSFYSFGKWFFFYSIQNNKKVFSKKKNSKKKYFLKNQWKFILSFENVAADFFPSRFNLCLEFDLQAFSNCKDFQYLGIEQNKSSIQRPKENIHHSWLLGGLKNWNGGLGNLFFNSDFHKEGLFCL